MATDNLFSIDETTSEGTSKVINARCAEDFTQFGKITKYALSEDGKFIQVEFTNTKGQTANRRVYLPKSQAEYVAKKNKTADEVYKSAVSIFMANITNVVRRYKGADYKVVGKSAAEVAQKVISDITPLLKNVQLYCIMELNESEKGIYTNIASFSPFSNINPEYKISSDQAALLAKKLSYSADAEKAPGTAASQSGEAEVSDDLPF